jgi:hypothetical protein
MAKNPHAQALGSLGGLARAAKLTPEQLSELGAKANAARKTKKGWPKGTPRGPRKPKPLP